MIKEIESGEDVFSAVADGGSSFYIIRDAKEHVHQAYRDRERNELMLDYLDTIARKMSELESKMSELESTTSAAQRDIQEIQDAGK